MELDQGGIYIDGLEVSKLGLAQLRNAMAIIPQVGPPFIHLVVPSIGSCEQDSICRVPVVYHVSMLPSLRCPPLPFLFTFARAKADSASFLCAQVAFVTVTLS